MQVQAAFMDLSLIHIFPVVVTEEFLAELFDSIFKNPKMEVEMNLPEQTITNKATGKSEHLEIND